MTEVEGEAEEFEGEMEESDDELPPMATAPSQTFREMDVHMLQVEADEVDGEDDEADMASVLGAACCSLPLAWRLLALPDRNLCAGTISP
eukprot:gene7027-6673_t